MATRLRRTPWRHNAQLPRPILDRFWPLPRAVLQAAQHTRLDAPTPPAEATRVLQIAWTLADLAGLDRPGVEQVDLARELRQPHPDA